MAQYVLRDPPQPLWSQVSTRAQLEGRSLRDLILGLLADYVDGRITPTQAPTLPRPRQNRDGSVWLQFTCPKCHKVMEVHTAASPGFGHMLFHTVECPFCHWVTERMLPGENLGAYPPGAWIESTLE